jgi:zeta-carotene desaturase
LNEQYAGLALNTKDKLELKIARQVHSPFTSILLWFDREITDLDHAWLLDTTIEWFFHKSRIRRYPPEKGSYVELVIAGSRAQLSMTRDEILSGALSELQLFFPDVKRAKLLKSGILKEARATFSVVPGLDHFRPTQATEWPGLYLAGDWTATEWPSTMEGAVRSGRLAAGAVIGDQERFMAAETQASGLMKWLGTR